MDEARIGLQVTFSSVWVPRGWRPAAVKQTRYEWVYRYAAVEPATGFSAPLLAPHVNTGTMNAFLKVLSAEVDPGGRGGDDLWVPIRDQAGWHRVRALDVSDNIARSALARPAMQKSRLSSSVRPMVYFILPTNSTRSGSLVLIANL